MREQVEKTIEVIRPALQADGGDIILHDVDEATGVVTVELTGACVGCPASTQTLKAGIERIMRDRVDGVTEVVDIAELAAELGVSRRPAARPSCSPPPATATAAAKARLLSLIERGGEAAREVGRLAAPARRRRLHGRPDRRAGRRQEHADARADHAPPPASARRSPCSPSTRRRRSPAGRSSATGCGCRTTPPTPACSSARWRRAATSAGCRWRRRRRSACSTPSGTAGSSSRPSASARSRSRSPARPTRPSSSSTPAGATACRPTKAGLMEVADVFVINKADRPGVDETPPRPAADARAVGRDGGAGERRVGGRRSSPRSAPTATGVAELWDAITAHRDHIAGSGVLEQRRRFRLGEELREIVARRLEQRARELCTGERWDELTDGVLARDRRPVVGRRRDARPRPVRQFRPDRGRISVTVRRPRPQQVRQLADDAVGVAEVAPPDVDDLPAELAQRAAPAGVAVLRRRRGVPLPALALDADAAGGVGEVELGEQDAALVADRVLVDEADAGPRRARRLASRWNQLRGRRWSTRSPSSISSAGGPARPRRRHAVADGAQLLGRRRPGAARCRAPGRSRPMPTTGASRARVAAIVSVGIPSTVADVVGRSSPRVRWTVDAETAVRVGAAGAEDVDGVVVARSRRGRAGAPRRRGRSRSTPGDERGGHRPAVERHRRRRPTASTPGHGAVDRARRARRPLLDAAGRRRAARAWAVDATPCWPDMSSNRACMPAMGVAAGRKGIAPSCHADRPDRADCG